jgi:ketosteroid isomerase-like protein
MRAILLAFLAVSAAPAMAQHHGQRPAPAVSPQAEDHDHASEADERAVLATIDRVFAALAAKDKAAMLNEVVPEGRATANDLGANRRVRGMSWPAFVDYLAQIPGRPVQRLVQPHVHVEGDIAMIWSRYELEIDGRFVN